ncbi:unnamed protein product [Dovyalis caffra]|uniref:RNase H type-1 domain-containing protein n=1 Tax=Dovyalis caffra TaxID=77055 RepID=A0AAV1SI81_9ROSI|nr:unnamed protein product [Dovyalis caffra]
MSLRYASSSSGCIEMKFHEVSSMAFTMVLSTEANAQISGACWSFLKPHMHLADEGEAILDKAQAFSTRSLESTIESDLAKQVVHVLELPSCGLMSNGTSTHVVTSQSCSLAKDKLRSDEKLISWSKPSGKWARVNTDGTKMEAIYGLCLAWQQGFQLVELEMDSALLVYAPKVLTSLNLIRTLFLERFW